jgi:uncharacterized protein (DUF1684 family)
MRLASLLGAGVVAAGVVALAAAPAPDYLTGIQQWRADREAKLKTPDGWLSVAGLFWLRDGESVVGSEPLSDVVLREGLPKRAGVLRVQAGTVTFEPANGPKSILKADVPGPPDVVRIGSVAMTMIKRGDRIGARLKDPDTATRLEFTGCKWFPAAKRWKVQAKWVPYPAPKTIKILNVLGMTLEEPAPGYAEFTLAGKQLRLEPIIEDDHLFFILKDSTAGKTTYGAGRYLYAAMPKGGLVELDFNKTENPPCAFTAFATCPLSPKQNILPIAIPAGEMKYGKH